MVSVGIDVAKDKHDCFILGPGGEVLEDVFTIPNSSEGFERLRRAIVSRAPSGEVVRVGLEATGHYSYNILGFLLESGFDTYVLTVDIPVPANGALVTWIGVPTADAAAAWPVKVACVSVMTSAVFVAASTAAAIAAAIPQGKMMFGPIAAILAQNSLMMAMIRALACATAAVAVAKLSRRSSAWLERECSAKDRGAATRNP